MIVAIAVLPMELSQLHRSYRSFDAAELLVLLSQAPCEEMSRWRYDYLTETTCFSNPFLGRHLSQASPRLRPAPQRKMM